MRYNDYNTKHLTTLITLKNKIEMGKGEERGTKYMFLPPFTNYQSLTILPNIGIY